MAHAMAKAKRMKKWWQDKQNLALITGFVSTVLTLVNMVIANF